MEVSTVSNEAGMELPRMANVQLNVPVLTGGILNTNFFNGRVLAAEDLTALQLSLIHI